MQQYCSCNVSASIVIQILWNQQGILIKRLVKILCNTATLQLKFEFCAHSSGRVWFEVNQGNILIPCLPHKLMKVQTQYCQETKTMITVGIKTDTPSNEKAQINLLTVSVCLLFCYLPISDEVQEASSPHKFLLLCNNF